MSNSSCQSITVAVLSNQKKPTSCFDNIETIYIHPCFKFSLLEFKELFFCNNCFSANSNLNNPTLLLSNYQLLNNQSNGINTTAKFVALQNLISVYESSNYFNLSTQCWKPMKLICLEKCIINHSSISNFNGVFKALCWLDVLAIMKNNCSSQNIILQIYLEFSCKDLGDDIPPVNICIQYSVCNPFYEEPKTFLAPQENCGDLILDDLLITNANNLRLKWKDIKDMNSISLETSIYSFMEDPPDGVGFADANPLHCILLNLCWQPCLSDINKKAQMNILIVFEPIRNEIYFITPFFKIKYTSSSSTSSNKYSFETFYDIDNKRTTQDKSLQDCSGDDFGTEGCPYPAQSGCIKPHESYLEHTQVIYDSDDNNSDFFIDFSIGLLGGVNLQLTESTQINNDNNNEDLTCLAKIDCECSSLIPEQEIFNSNNTCDNDSAAIYIDNCYMIKVENDSKVDVKKTTQIIMKYGKCCRSEC